MLHIGPLSMNIRCVVLESHAVKPGITVFSCEGELIEKQHPSSQRGTQLCYFTHSGCHLSAEVFFSHILYRAAVFSFLPSVAGPLWNLAFYTLIISHSSIEAANEVNMRNGSVTNITFISWFIGRNCEIWGEKQIKQLSFLPDFVVTRARTRRHSHQVTEVTSR